VAETEILTREASMEAVVKTITIDRAYLSEGDMVPARRWGEVDSAE
jgi:hypothetical protein